MTIELSAWWEDRLMFCAVCERRQVHVSPEPWADRVAEDDERLCVQCGAAVWLGTGGQPGLGRSA